MLLTNTCTCRMNIYTNDCKQLICVKMMVDQRLAWRGGSVRNKGRTGAGGEGGQVETRQSNIARSRYIEVVGMQSLGCWSDINGVGL